MNKVLMVILGLVLLNLGREYVFDNVPRMEYPPEKLSHIAAAGLQPKDWGYYKAIFGNEGQTTIAAINSLPLVLRGTVVGGPRDSFAVIEDPATGQQDLYRLGDLVFAGARIVAMNRDRVVVDYNGVKTELKIGGSKKMLAAGQQMFNLPPAGPGPEAAGQGTETVMNFAELLTQLRIKPYFAGGRCVGFQLSNIRSDLVKQMGLRNGDIIESVNGMRLNDPLKAMQILYGMGRNNPIHLGIERRDEKMELDCRLEG